MPPPCVVLALYTCLSSVGVYSQLAASKEGQDEAAKLLHLATSGHDFDASSAKRLALTVLEAVLQTQLGVFFAANFAAGFYATFFLITKTLFLGQLTASESAQLAERLLKLAVLKAAFLLVVQSPGFGSMLEWLAWCAVSCWFSLFCKLASLRGDALLSSPSATLAQHARTLLLLGGILAQEASWVAEFLQNAHGMRGRSLSMALLWLFDAAFVAVDAAFALVKYACQAAAHYRAMQGEAHGEDQESWCGGTSLVYSLDLASDLSLACLTLGHYLHLWWLHGLQLQLIDLVLLLDMRLLVGFIQRRLRRHNTYRRLHHQLCHAFEDAGPQAAVGTCCICLEAMKAGKLLPCGHIMHLSCLCTWLQQSSQGTCPMCRAGLDIHPQPQPLSRFRTWAWHSPHTPRTLDFVQPSNESVSLPGACPAVPLPAGKPISRSAARPYTRLQARLAKAAATADAGNVSV